VFPDGDACPVCGRNVDANVRSVGYNLIDVPEQRDRGPSGIVVDTYPLKRPTWCMIPDCNCRGALFETKVSTISHNGPGNGGIIRRYHTYDEALDGHRSMVESFRRVADIPARIGYGPTDRMDTNRRDEMYYICGNCYHIYSAEEFGELASAAEGANRVCRVCGELVDKVRKIGDDSVPLAFGLPWGDDGTVSMRVTTSPLFANYSCNIEGCNCNMAFFETTVRIVFPSSSGHTISFAIYSRRYHNDMEASIGHHAMLRVIMEAVPEKRDIKIMSVDAGSSGQLRLIDL